MVVGGGVWLRVEGCGYWWWGVVVGGGVWLLGDEYGVW